MRAIIFDFFGTLTDPAAESERLTTFAATATALGVPADRFTAAMAESFPRRATGVYGGTRDTLLAMARACGAEPSPARLAAAVRTHHAGAERVRRPRPDAIRTLSGCGTGATSWGFSATVRASCARPGRARRTRA
ncbi:hypothetical protein Asi03nite_39700 [Actinoplanes siamensis]|uniref:Hydrolase of the HAD superfamily n=1 Tax=Actinoplanes siamensis TaxID=1223317 RepID=A0A919N8I2_9ACTN|nr:hypothetical protein Asi03nite_39700 [Actinoplanes siamensis]